MMMMMMSLLLWLYKPILYLIWSLDHFIQKFHVNKILELSMIIVNDNHLFSTFYDILIVIPVLIGAFDNVLFLNW